MYQPFSLWSKIPSWVQEHVRAAHVAMYEAPVSVIVCKMAWPSGPHAVPAKWTALCLVIRKEWEQGKGRERNISFQLREVFPERPKGVELGVMEERLSSHSIMSRRSYVTALARRRSCS